MGCMGSKAEKADNNNAAAADTKGKTTKAQDDEPDYSFKILIVGDIAVGKSNLVHRFTAGKYAGEELPASTGADYVPKDLTVDGHKVRVKIWDTAGQEKFQQITASYYRGSHGCIVCYDITKEDSFNNLETWCSQVDKQAMGNVSKVVVGCKSDLEESRAVKQDAGREFAESKGFGFFEASSKAGTGVQEAWEALVRQCVQAHKNK
eukprot:TRINITY_DN1228_c0_g1_i2.p1 TRINITY_DN1228_c0_g1~~TRINITY_DN1228_c0_g1_i2.p1  ORF type:complete len:206 (+),score=36.34 TRINITY_DN1228_c0_g1_i2:53-670(+)